MQSRQDLDPLRFPARIPATWICKLDNAAPDPASAPCLPPAAGRILTVADCCSSTGTFRQVFCNSSVVSRDMPMLQNVRRTFDRSGRRRGPRSRVRIGLHIGAARYPPGRILPHVQADETGLCRALSVAIHPFFLSHVYPIGKVDDNDDADAAKLFPPHAGG
jgi:hypothetical protein